MIEIGPQLQASQIDPDEVAAWNQVGAMLAQQGCSYGGLTVQWMQATTSTLTSKGVSDKAKALADQLWHDYSAQNDDEYWVCVLKRLEGLAPSRTTPKPSAGRTIFRALFRSAIEA